jgi:thiamine-phosphate pyrophosphorylase
MYPVQFLTADISDYPHVKQVRDACEAGFRWIQYRTKNTDIKDWIDTAKQIRLITLKYKATFIVNDNIDVALSSNADGLHVGKEDLALPVCRMLMPNKIIGYSCNTINDIIYAQQQGANYAGIGPYKFTGTKSKLNPLLGNEGLQKVITTYNKLGLTIPLVAIGGIDYDDLSTLKQLGLNNIAVSSAITRELAKGNLTPLVKMIFQFTNKSTT